MKRDIEDQPRYKIDEGAAEEEYKILSEAQAEALLKLVQNAGHVLSGEEREIVQKLVDKLNQETERVKSLRKMTVGDKTLDAYLAKAQRDSEKKKLGAGARSSTSNSKALVESNGDEPVEEGETEEIHEQKVKHIVGFKPDEVVKRYIECWNQQKFGAEFDCFSSDFMAIDRDQYIDARHASFKNSLAEGGRRIDFIRFDSCDVTGGEAEIVAVKQVQTGKKKAEEETDLYRLKLEKGRWVIYSVEPQ